MTDEANANSWNYLEAIHLRRWALSRAVFSLTFPSTVTFWLGTVRIMAVSFCLLSRATSILNSREISKFTKDGGGCWVLAEVSEGWCGKFRTGNKGLDSRVNVWTSVSKKEAGPGE